MYRYLLLLVVLLLPTDLLKGSEPTQLANLFFLGVGSEKKVGAATPTYHLTTPDGKYLTTPTGDYLDILH